MTVAIRNIIFQANINNGTLADGKMDDNLVNTSSSASLMSVFNSTALPLNDIAIPFWLRIFFVGIYCLIFIIGISGNSLVIYIVVRSKPMQTITNLFIVNLAISDVVMCLLAVPFTPMSYFLNEWVFGSFLCHLVPMILGVSVYVSTLSSTVVAIDRYFVIVHPFKPRMTTSVCLIVIGVIWFISSSISLPLAVFHTLIKEGAGQTRCEELWPSPTGREFFTVASLLLQYLVPCAVIAFCYMQVSQALQRRERRRAGLGSSQREEADIRRKRRTNRMLIAMVAIFMCCWLPLNVVLMTANYFPALDSTAPLDTIFFVAHIIAMSSTMYNPFLYAWMNDGFKKEFQAILPFLRRRTRKHRAMSEGMTTIGETTFVANRGSPEHDNNDASVYYQPDGDYLRLSSTKKAPYRDYD